MYLTIIIILMTRWSLENTVEHEVEWSALSADMLGETFVEQSVKCSLLFVARARVGPLPCVYVQP